MHLIAILLFLAVQKFEHQDECINPAMESMSWRQLEGEVAAVEANGEIRIVKVVEEMRRPVAPRVVSFANVEIDPSALPYLRSLIGKRIKVWINPRRFDDERVIGLLYRGDEDLNRRLLARGLGRYARPEAYSLSDYSDCLHRIAEREARAARRGVWAEQRR